MSPAPHHGLNDPEVVASKPKRRAARASRLAFAGDELVGHRLHWQGGAEGKRKTMDAWRKAVLYADPEKSVVAVAWELSSAFNNEEGWSNRMRKTLADNTGYKEDTIKKAIKWLVTNGLLVRGKVPYKGKSTSAVFPAAPHFANGEKMLVLRPSRHQAASRYKKGRSSPSAEKGGDAIPF